MVLARALGGGDETAGEGFREVIESIKRRLGEKNPALYKTYHRLAMVCERLGDGEEAVRDEGRSW